MFRTKDEGQYIKHLIVDLIEDFGLTNQVSSKIESKGDRWFRIEIKYPSDLDADTWMNISGTFMAAFGAEKGWYECREEGRNDDGTVEWYVCRDKGGPWL